MSDQEQAVVVDFEEEWDDELECTHCGGESHVWGSDIPGDYGWYRDDELYSCPACDGTGLRSRQRVF